MDEKRVLYHAVCKKNGQHYIIETNAGDQLVTGFLDISDEEAASIHLKAWSSLKTAPNLRRCPWCGTDVIGSCTCQQQRDCPKKGDYRYPCLFCKELQSAERSAKDLTSLKISATKSNFDNIGAVLSSMQLYVRSFEDTGFDCDILFINCGTESDVDPVGLREFVRKGGCLYASDWAEEQLRRAFPNCGVFAHTGRMSTIKAIVIDREIAGIVGNIIDVTFDLGAWAQIESHKGTALIKTATFPQKTLMFTFTEGDGTVFYTSFHNHAQASQTELMILKTMLARQIGTVTSMTTDEVLKKLGIHINLVR